VQRAILFEELKSLYENEKSTVNNFALSNENELDQLAISLCKKKCHAIYCKMVWK